MFVLTNPGTYRNCLNFIKINATNQVYILKDIYSYIIQKKLIVKIFLQSKKITNT